MNVINIDEIRAMSAEEKAALDRATMRKIALHIAGVVFIKCTAPRLAQTLATGAILAVARRVK